MERVSGGPDVLCALHTLQALFRHQPLSLRLLEPVTACLWALFTQGPSVSTCLCQGCLSALVSEGMLYRVLKAFYLPLSERPRLFSPREQVHAHYAFVVSCASPRERAEVVVQ